MASLSLEFSPLKDTYTPLKIHANSLSIEARYYAAQEKGKALLTVGGVGGGFDTPARGLYPFIGQELCQEGISTLHLQYRRPTDLATCIQDVLYGIEALSSLEHKHMALIGHSLGGTVVIAAAAQCPSVISVITLATQSYGAIQAAKMLRKQPLLLIHGLKDDNLPPACSEQIYNQVHGPKELIFLPGAGHALDEAANEVKRLCLDWIRSTL
ncbi:alpha/beta hydrolase family protein [Candidatus Protochlamydia phocaeensis]|uniref:alpha/beta hydrolase family protein n=1 Tax=Candidatus Protochlamydia phocaeensis TaxID=1414722 RepID=UPI00083983B4|nr:prolyl oligopeptidase family serine peptidase [Candidatus Protochlamydia phocaeensis]